MEALRTSLREQLAALRGTSADALPPPLLDVTVRRVGDVFVVEPADWDALRDEEGAAARPVPYWARLWPSARALADWLVAAPPPRGARVLELGCGLGLPSVVAARAGARVLATDGHSDAVAFAAHSLALNELEAEVAHVDWGEHGEALVARGPWDVVLASDVLYLRANVEAALRLVPRLIAPGGELRITDPGRAGARDFLAAARASFRLVSERADAIALHTLRPR